MAKKKVQEPKQLTVTQLAQLFGGISRQAVLKKITNTLDTESDSDNKLPASFTVQRMGTMGRGGHGCYIIGVPADFKFGKRKKAA